MQTSYAPQSPQPSVPNYLVQAILTTIFCCLPFGIVSIVYAAQVNGKVAAGDHAGALESSRNARMWAWIAFGAGLVVGVGYLILFVLGAIAQS
jgi:predicted secreted protein